MRLVYTRVSSRFEPAALFPLNTPLVFGRVREVAESQPRYATESGVGISFRVGGGNGENRGDANDSAQECSTR